MEQRSGSMAEKEEPIGRLAGRLAIASLAFGNAVLAVSWALHRTTWIDRVPDGPLAFLAVLGSLALLTGGVSALVWVATPTGRKGRLRPAWLATGLIIGVGCLMCLGLCGTRIRLGIPPSSRTLTNMYLLERDILRYANSHDALPPSLSALPPPTKREFTPHPLNDVWDRPILYQVNADGWVTLTSYGKDGRPGGFRDAQDVVHRFQTRRPDGSWRRQNDFKIWPATQSTQPTNVE